MLDEAHLLLRILTMALIGPHLRRWSGRICWPGFCL
jgi:hypothetical protein